VLERDNRVNQIKNVDEKNKNKAEQSVKRYNYDLSHEKDGTSRFLYMNMAVPSSTTS